jgi:hypothetical protein
MRVDLGGRRIIKKKRMNRDLLLHFLGTKRNRCQSDGSLKRVLGKKDGHGLMFYGKCER